MSSLRWLSLAIRLFAVALVAISPWLQPTSRPSNARSVVYLVDRSASIGTHGLELTNLILTRAYADRRDARLGVVAFDGRAEVISAVGASSAPTISAGKEPRSSDLASGIRLAHASLPQDGHRTIVLLTDARPTRGDAAAEVRRAADHGIRVDVVPLDGEAAVLPLVTGTRARATHVAEGQPIALDVDVAAKAPFLVQWTRDGVPMRPRVEYAIASSAPADVGSGAGDPDPDAVPEKVGPESATHRVELVDPAPPPGVHVYEVKATAYSGWGGGGPRDDAPSLLTAVSVEGKAHAAGLS
jgi:hypothetical protein